MPFLFKPSLSHIIKCHGIYYILHYVAENEDKTIVKKILFFYSLNKKKGFV